MSGIISLPCAILAIILIMIVAVRNLSPGNKKPSGAELDGHLNTTLRKRRNWIPPIIIALILGIWMIWAALFFIAAVWFLWLDPKVKLSNIVTDDEKKVCTSNYGWLRNSSFVTIPVFVIAMFMGAPPAVAALIPFVFHISIMGRLDTKNLFVFRHTQQTLFLLVLRAATATIIFSSLILGDALWTFIIVNGALWLFGTNWEVSQVLRNDCWLMRYRGEEIIVSETGTAVIPPEKPGREDRIDDLLRELNVEGNTARQKALRAFQIGTPEMRKKAVMVLSELGEVEKF